MFIDAMLADHKSWAQNVERKTTFAIARAIAGTCIPWLSDWSRWRAHASDFFCRLCQHRADFHRHVEGRFRNVGTRACLADERLAFLEAAVHELQARDRDVSVAVQQLQARDRHLNEMLRHHQAAESGPQPATARSHPQAIESGPRPTTASHRPLEAAGAQARSLSMPEQILCGQLSAVSRRSHSPLHDAHKLLEAHSQSLPSVWLPGHRQANSESNGAEDQPNAVDALDRSLVVPSVPVVPLRSLSLQALPQQLHFVTEDATQQLITTSPTRLHTYPITSCTLIPMSS